MKNVFARARMLAVGVVLAGTAAFAAPAGGGWVIESRLFKGTRPQGPLRPGDPVIVSSYSDLMFGEAQRPALPSFDPMAAIKSELAALYNLLAVDQINASRLYWDGKRDRVSQAVLAGGVLLPINVFPRVIDARSMGLRIEMLREREAGLPEKLLDSEIVVRMNEPVVMGFPLDGDSFFVSFLVRRPVAGEVGPGAPAPRVEGEIDFMTAHTILPMPVYTVMPDYPERLKKRGVEGDVVFYVETNREGKVRDLKPAEGSHADFVEPAARAVRQWRYKPVLWKGKPIYSRFYLKVQFSLRPPDPAASEKDDSSPREARASYVLSRIDLFPDWMGETLFTGPAPENSPFTAPPFVPGARLGWR